MKNCSSCRHCVMDWHALMMGLYIKQCGLRGHNILHPFWSGWRCKRFEKRGTNHG